MGCIIICSTYYVYAYLNYQFSFSTRTVSTVPHFHIYSESKVNIERKVNSADVTSVIDDRQLIEAHKSREFLTN